MAAHIPAVSQDQSRPQTVSAAPIALPAIGYSPIISTGPARLEIGVLHSTHGWLKVRAEMTGAGNVNASLTVNASSHEAMRTALPEIAGYIQSGGISLAKLDLHPVSNSDTSSDLAAEGQAAGSSSSDQRREEATSQAANSGQGNFATSNEVDDIRAVLTPVIKRIPMLAPMWAQVSSATGGWLSICA